MKIRLSQLRQIIREELQLHEFKGSKLFRSLKKHLDKTTAKVSSIDPNQLQTVEKVDLIDSLEDLQRVIQDL